MTPGMTPAIDLRDVTVIYGGGALRRAPPFTALDRVSLAIAPGAVHGIVGESGSGKTTLGRVILGLQDVAGGDVRVLGQPVASGDRAARRAFRARVQCVFQDSAASLDPRRSIGASVREGLDIHRIGSEAQRQARVAAMLGQVGLGPDHAARYPHELSGGQRQRVNIARSLVLEPRILVADEPVSALDVSVQAQVLDLLARLRAEMGLTMVFISHDLHVVREICDTGSVMKDGRIVEQGATAHLYDAPSHPYTRTLIAASLGPGSAAPQGAAVRV